MAVRTREIRECRRKASSLALAATQYQHRWPHPILVIDPNSLRVPARRRQIRALSRHPETEPPQHSHQGPRLFRCGTGSATALAIDHRPEHLLVKRVAADAEIGIGLAARRACPRRARKSSMLPP